MTITREQVLEVLENECGEYLTNIDIEFAADRAYNIVARLPQCYNEIMDDICSIFLAGKNYGEYVELHHNDPFDD